MVRFRCLKVLPPMLLLLCAAAQAQRHPAAGDSLVPAALEEEPPRPYDPPPRPPEPAARPALDPALLDSWQEKLGKAKRDLDAADFAGVLRKTGKVRAEMQRFAREEEKRLPGLVAQDFLLRALAEQATGSPVDALFDLHAARFIDPGLEAADLALYGEPGVALAAAFAAEPQEIAGQLADGDPSVVLPKQLEAVDGTPLAGLGAEVTEPVKVAAVIDLEGRIRQPKPLGPLHPLVAIGLFDGLRGARFEPARRGGRPVMVHFELRLGG